MIKTLAGCIGKYKKDSIIAPLFVILEVLGEICIPFLVSNLIDYGIDKGNMDYILKIGSILVLCTILTLICSFIAGRSAAIASQETSGRLCMQRFKIFHFLILISFQPQVLSQGSRLMFHTFNTLMIWQFFRRREPRQCWLFRLQHLLELTKNSLSFPSVYSLFGMRTFLHND